MCSCPKDYVRFRLTGQRATDAADASGTLLFDVARRCWSEELCAALEIPIEWLPPVFEATEVGGAGDQAAAALGVGIVQPGLVSVVLGTSGVVFAVLPAYAPDDRARVHVFCHAAPGMWHAMGVMLSAAGSLAWLQHVLVVDYGTLDAEAERWPPRVEGLQFAPYLAGERRRTRIRRPGGVPWAFAPPRSTAWSERNARSRCVGLRGSLELLRDLGVEPRGRARFRGRKSQLALGEDRRVGPRPPTRTHRGRGGLGVRGRTSRWCPRRCVRQCRRRRQPVFGSAHASSRRSPGSRCTSRDMRATARCTRRSVRSIIGELYTHLWGSGDPRPGLDVEEEHRPSWTRSRICRRWWERPGHSRDHVARRGQTFAAPQLA